uniref:Mitochondrial folate transporter/carrier n=1 Tax=Acrobeloides nanus TaxID=290746 RepID=A0A914C3P2_9BILA
MFSGYEHLIGGLAGGFASTVVCHPFDLLRIRYSANEGSSLRPQYRSYLHAATSIVKANGIRGLYQGLSPNIIAAPLSWGLYFQIYHKIRARVEPFQNQNVNNLLVGTGTGVVVLAMTNPFWVVKTRLCLQYENQGVRKYSGMIDCYRKILRYEGWMGLYKGFIPGLVGTVNGAIQFAIYNYLKDWRCRLKNIPQDSPLETSDYLLYSCLSKILSTLLTFPYQVVRTRQQDHNADYKGVIDVLLRTYKGEGILGFYKGALIATFKQTPNAIVTYVVYEHARRIAESFNNN